MLTRTLVALVAFLVPAFAQYQPIATNIVPTDPVSGAAFGAAVALSADGTTAIMGAPSAGLYTGGAWIFSRSFKTVTQQAKLVATDATGPGEFGTSVALSADGNTAVVGGPFDNNFTGAVWVFTRTGSTWTQQGSKLVGTGSAGAAQQGQSVAISGDGNTILVGGPLDNGNAGAAWIFTRTGGGWTQSGTKLVGSGASSPAQQGTAVALSSDGTTALIGGPSDSAGASFWPFAQSGGAWSQQGSKLGMSGTGIALAISGNGNTALAGRPDGAAPISVFTRSNGSWSLRTSIPGTSGEGGSLGISSDGNTAIIGGNMNGAPGVAYVVGQSGGAWTVIGGGYLPMYASAVAISGDGQTVLGGNPLVNDAAMFGAPPPPARTAVTAVSPTSGSGYTGTFTFTFFDSLGVQKLQVVNVLIASALDGRHACYIAFASGTVNLVDDSGDANGPYATLSLPGTGSIQNSQCSISAAGSSYTSAGNTLTLTLAMAFSPAFAGNKVLYAAAIDATSNSGWQAMGVWNIPGPPPSGPAVSGMTAASGTYSFQFTDTNGWQDLSVLNILVNSAIDGRHACYLAYVPSGAAAGTLYVVDDAGDAGGPYSSLILPGSNSVSNSQCTIAATGSSVAASGNNLTLTLPIAFSHSQVTNQIFYLAARSSAQNSGWQAAGAVTIP